MKRWTTKPLGEVAEFINGRAFKPSDWSSRGVPIIRIQNLTNPTAFTNRFEGAFDERHAVKDDDLLVSWSATLDVFVWNRGDAVLNQHIFRAIPDSSQVSKTYLFYALKSVMDELRSKTHGATMKHITKGPFERTLIPVPPLAEQGRLVKLLDEAGELRKLRAQADRRTAALIPSLFHEMFGDVAINYKTATIEDAVEQFIDYRGKTPEKSASGVPLVTAKIVKGGSIFPPGEFIPEGNYDAWMRRGLPRVGDVLFTMEAPLGEVAMVENARIALAQRILLMRPRFNLLDSRYFMTALKMPSVWKQIEERATGSTVRGIRQAELRKVVMPIPSLPLQKEFAARVSEIRAMQVEQSASHRRLDDLFQSLLHRAFRGEL